MSPCMKVNLAAHCPMVKVLYSVKNSRGPLRGTNWSPGTWLPVGRSGSMQTQWTLHRNVPGPFTGDGTLTTPDPETPLLPSASRDRMAHVSGCHQTQLELAPVYRRRDHPRREPPNLSIRLGPRPIAAREKDPLTSHHRQERST